jgi:hypothetical protein
MHPIARFAVVALVLTCLPVLKLRADTFVPYPTPGVENPITYTFTAASSGDVTAYFVGSGASFTNDLGLLVNGVSQGGLGLNNHTSLHGAFYDFGFVAAGSTLTFQMHNIIPGLGDLYSDPALNQAYDGTPGVSHNHIYSTAYVADGLTPGNGTAIPAGTYTYVAFEDLRAGGPPDGPPDWNYNDEDFVFANVAAAPVPLPSTAVFGCVLLGGLWVRRRIVRRAAA